MTEILYLYSTSVKIDGGGVPNILSCKDSGISPMRPDGNPAVKIEG